MITKQMKDYFKKRTDEHIDRVIQNISVLPDNYMGYDKSELLERANLHDNTKFSDSEFLPYIYCTEFHRCKDNNIPFTYPDGIEEKVKQATKHHILNNKHHPECLTPNKMNDIDLIEMVADWKAMAQEKNENSGSPLKFARDNINKRWDFNEKQKEKIYQIINDMDNYYKMEGKMSEAKKVLNLLNDVGDLIDGDAEVELEGGDFGIDLDELFLVLKDSSKLLGSLLSIADEKKKEEINNILIKIRALLGIDESGSIDSLGKVPNLPLGVLSFDKDGKVSFKKSRYLK